MWTLDGALERSRYLRIFAVSLVHYSDGYPRFLGTLLSAQGAPVIVRHPTSVPFRAVGGAIQSCELLITNLHAKMVQGLLAGPKIAPEVISMIPWSVSAMEVELKQN